MSRNRRHWYPGAIYHITCRGNRRQEIYRDDQDRRVYLGRLLKAKTDHNCSILSYCLMGNHVHLQVETADVAIWKMMKQLNMSYSIYFNRKHDCVGHLFQGRYRSKLIEQDAHNLGVSRYIHLNPVEAHIVQRPEDYKWSSYQSYLGLFSDPVVSPEKVLAYFPWQSRESYRQFVEQSLGEG